MTENSNQPKEYDVVLGGRSSVPADGVVLGGVDRVKQVLAIEGVEQKIDALLDALQYGQEGLDYSQSTPLVALLVQIDGCWSVVVKKTEP